MKSLVFAAALALGAAGLATAQTPPGDGVTQQGTNPEGQACTPAGFNQGTSGYPSCDQVNRPTHDATNAPPCSREVTDHCVQTYERGVRR